MRIGVLKELTPGETRVSLTPHAVYELVGAGHEVLVESGAGFSSSLADEDYEQAGAEIVGEAEDVYGSCELIVKVYGPVSGEYKYLREGMLLLSFMSLAINPGLLRALADSGCLAFSMETIQDDTGRLPLLTPMSEIAGSLVPQIGAHYLQRHSGGRGVLLGGAPGVRPGRVVVLGAGIVGTTAARVCSGLGANVTVIDRDVDRLRHLERARLRRVTTLASTSLAIRNAVLEADLVIGAIHVVGARTPHLVDRATVEEMNDGSVIVDVDVDYGGCVETSRPTTLSSPTFKEHGITHYCVKNVPALVPITSTRALSNAALPLVERLASLGAIDALNAEPALRRGASVIEGRVVNSSLAEVYGLDFHPVSSVLPLHPEAR